MIEKAENEICFVNNMLVMNSGEKHDSIGELRQKFRHLLCMQQLRKSIVKENMHNAMSPISSISGYLELINMALKEDANVHQIEQYRKRIEIGITEVNEILQQLNKLYEEVQHEETEEEALEVDLNWAVRDVCNQLDPSSLKIKYGLSQKPLYLKVALYTMKLIIYKLISYAMKCSSSKSSVRVETYEREGLVDLFISFNVSKHKADDIRKVLSCSNEKDEYEYTKQNPMNEGLLASRKLVDQIGGRLIFNHTNDTSGKLSLSLPTY
ncbi:hypothetical protein ACKGJO_06235 [Gracilimonas sp. Q87]|uniref:hypothetical protein n=1 Tax=Gracilimonas sp. Q87 TaxID=3384766 RepID=UPI003984226E